MVSCTGEASLVFFNVAFRLTKAAQFSMRFTLAIVDTMPAQDHWSRRLSGTVFTGSRLMLTQRKLFVNVMVARNMLARPMCRLKS